MTSPTTAAAPSQQAWVFVGLLVHSTETEAMQLLEDTAIGIKDGKIIFMEPAQKLDATIKLHSIPEDRVVRMSRGQLLMPGFVDCHAHASQYSFMGTGTDLQLLDWLNKYTFPAESRLHHEPDFGLAVYQKCVDRTLRCGTTTISYYATISRKSTMALVEAIESRGQRAFVGKVNMDINSPEGYRETREESAMETERFVTDVLNKKCSTIHPCITPRFAVSCSMDLMKDLSAIAHKHNLPIQTHVSENMKEIDTVRQHYPQIDSYTQVYEEAGLLGPKTMLAHAVHLSPKELDLVKRRESGICHCPNSNFTLTSGVMDLRHMMNLGVKVGLGTDFGGGSSPSMLDAIRRGLDAAKVHDMKRKGCITSMEDCSAKQEIMKDQASSSQEEEMDDTSTITYKHLFRLATLGSSQVMGLDDVIGNFQVGKDFDAILVDVNSAQSPIDSFCSDSTEDLLQKFIILGDDRNIVRVFVQGREVIGPISTS